MIEKIRKYDNKVELKVIFLKINELDFRGDGFWQNLTSKNWLNIVGLLLQRMPWPNLYQTPFLVDSVRRQMILITNKGSGEVINTHLNLN